MAPTPNFGIFLYFVHPFSTEVDLQGAPFKFTGSMYYEPVNLNGAPCKFNQDINIFNREQLNLV